MKTHKELIFELNLYEYQLMKDVDRTLHRVFTKAAKRAWMQGDDAECRRYRNEAAKYERNR